MGLFVIQAIVSCAPKQSAEEQALDFLYAYMPLPDSVDYSRDFWLANVRASLQAREEMPWGASVPEREWKHFVLPVRVNNENLDTSRLVFYAELKDRVQGLSMYDAALEVNHWCHEHVTYQPSDSRTSAPLATLRSAIGRCGEESTFAVAALRSVGIPARQVYTPRWAHTDDNHAWVEVWVDGQWHFLGACEPEPVLDLGWFNAPASRGMMMHTRVFGAYDGPEEVLYTNACYTEINVTSNYAPVDNIEAQVVDAEGHPTEATVDFRLYNYAEFYPLATKKTDAQGIASLQCGLGDLVLWATDGTHFGFAKASVGQDKRVTVRLCYDAQSTASLDLELTPPAERNTLPDLTDEQVQNNKQRLAQEDSIRTAYMQQAFYHEGDELIRASRANHSTIEEYLGHSEEIDRARSILKMLSQKDLRDVTLDVLRDHYNHCQSTDPYIAGPRIMNELLTPWRGALQQVLPVMSATEWVRWCTDSLTINETRNPQHLCMSPMGVYRHRMCDTRSRDIFFVAGARSMNIPARIDGVTGKVQWADAKGEWHDVQFHEEAQVTAPQGTLQLQYATGAQHDPTYYSHFTLSRIQDGVPNLQEYPEGSTTFATTFASGTSVDAGQYILCTGTRLASGGVLAHVELFGVAAQDSIAVPLVLRQSTDQLQVIGSFDSESHYLDAQGTERSVLSTTGRGYFAVCLLRPNHEPSNHALRDLIATAGSLEQWGRSILLLFPTQADLQAFRPEDFPGLPTNAVLGVACNDILRSMQEQHLATGPEFPFIWMSDTFNRIVWTRQGYTIGLGEQLLQVIQKL